MNSMDLSWIVILEAVLPFLILSILLILLILSGRKKLKQASKLLILNVKANEEKEKQAILDFLKTKLGFDEKIAKKTSKNIIKERKFLIRNLVSGILNKDVETIGQLNEDLCRISKQYHQLDIKIPEPEVVDEGVSEEQLEAEGELKSEIKGLKQEVHITLTTLNNIFKEFSSMFGEDDIPEGEMSVDQIITAMESFSGKSAQNDSSDDSSETISTDTTSVEEHDEVVGIDEEESATIEDEPSSDTSENDEALNFAVDSAIDDIDNALDGLELGETDSDSDSDSDTEEPDWGDAFAESGDTMDEDNLEK